MVFAPHSITWVLTHMDDKTTITAYGPAKIAEVISDYADEQDAPLTPSDEAAEWILEENRDELLNIPFKELMVACHGLTEFYGRAINDYRVSEQEAEATSGFDDWRKVVRCAYPYFIVKGAIHLQMKNQYNVIGRQQTTATINHWPIETLCRLKAQADDDIIDAPENKPEDDVIMELIYRSPLKDLTFPAKVHFMDVLTEEFDLASYEGDSDTVVRESLHAADWRDGVTDVTLEDITLRAIKQMP